MEEWTIREKSKRGGTTVIKLRVSNGLYSELVIEMMKSGQILDKLQSGSNKVYWWNDGREESKMFSKLWV